MLTHVCRRWPCIVFASPRRLNLILRCKTSKPVRVMLDTWSPVPIVIFDYNRSEKGANNIIAALEHNDRVCGIYTSSSLLERFASAM